MKKYLFLALTCFIFSTSIDSTEPQMRYAAAFIDAPHLSGKNTDQIFFITRDGNRLTIKDLNQVADLLIAEFSKNASVAQQQELADLRNTFAPLGNNFLLQRINDRSINFLITISFDTSWHTLNKEQFMNTYKKGFSREYANWLETKFLTKNCVIIINPNTFSCASI